MKKTAKTKSTAHVVNRRASFDYKLSDKLVVGLVLTGAEVRAARNGYVSLRGAFVTIRDQELWLNNASFTLPRQTRGAEAVISTKPRKLLATKTQIRHLVAKKVAGMSIIPTRMITHGRYIKLEIALGVGKKLYDKRQAIKERQMKRETRWLIG